MLSPVGFGRLQGRTYDAGKEEGDDGQDDRRRHRRVGDRSGGRRFCAWSINPSEEVDATLRKVEDEAKERGLEFASEASDGDPAEVLCDIAGDHGADVIVVGNKGMERRLLGSVPNTVAHKAPCSVLVVKTT